MHKIRLLLLFVCVCTCVWRPKVDVFLSCFPFYFLRPSISISIFVSPFPPAPPHQMLSDLARLAGRWTPGIFHLCSPSAWMTVMCCHIQLFTRVLGMKFIPSCLQGNSFARWAVSPALFVYFLHPCIAMWADVYLSVSNSVWLRF